MKAFTEADLNEIAERDETCCSQLLSYIFRRHRTVLIGGYDLYVVTEALHGKGKNLSRQDYPLLVENINLNEESLMGILVSDIYRTQCGHCNYTHWIALRNVDGAWYNFDSKLAAPQRFANGDAVHDFLEDVNGHPYSRVYLVRNQFQL